MKQDFRIGIEIKGKGDKYYVKRTIVYSSFISCIDKKIHNINE